VSRPVSAIAAQLASCTHPGFVATYRSPASRAATSLACVGCGARSDDAGHTWTLPTLVAELGEHSPLGSDVAELGTVDDAAAYAAARERRS
jgi:hypothetical protein